MSRSIVKLRSAAHERPLLTNATDRFTTDINLHYNHDVTHVCVLLVQSDDVTHVCVLLVQSDDVTHVCVLLVQSDDVTHVCVLLVQSDDVTHVCVLLVQSDDVTHVCVLLVQSDDDVTCVSTESVRLVSGSGLCSGSVQIWDGSWTGVCDGDLDQRGAEVLCRELDCGAPSLLQGALSPLGQTFHCEGHESALMDCPRSNSRTCSSGATVNLTCSELLRLVGGASRCAGTVEVKHRGEWRRLEVFGRWEQDHTSAVCRDLDCLT
ncbi:deleted in malignant brain tumors 1 protein-like [Boleophthalmus pectinirostris]|uniref:deleted in malignant brain tumors 1 protein-like n=1 Tax=Boleophthalmus pectinirostris TaxID=150288 RepID=UPI002430105D|nr:deleted in malignant brain tumors 1 protein-like [Boleophthalmus pectinirostris]